MWVMEENVLKCATEDFSVAINSQDVGSDVTLDKSSDNPAHGKWIIKFWGWSSFISYKTDTFGSDDNSVSTVSDCFMPVREKCEDGCDWREAADACDWLNGTLAVVDEDETMFEVTCVKEMLHNN